MRQAILIIGDPHDHNTDDLVIANNGVIDLVTGELKAHSPHVLTTRRLCVDYAPHANVSIAKDSLDDSTRLDEHTRQTDAWLQTASQVVDGSNPEHALMCLGPRRSRKSTSVIVLMELVEDEQQVSLALESLDGFMLSNLQSSMLCSNDELQAYVPSATPFKRLLRSGRITADRKSLSAITFQPSCLFAWAANQSPRFKWHRTWMPPWIA